MGQVSKYLRKTEDGFAHWCPGCEEMHTIWTNHTRRANWNFDGNIESPTFEPSVCITYNGADAGQDRGDGFGKAPPAKCHYFLRAGNLQFCPDTTHAFAGKTVPLPALPSFMSDEANR